MRNMKQFITVLSFVGILIVATSGFSKNECTHTWSEWIREEDSPYHSAVCIECGEKKAVRHSTASVTVSGQPRSVCLVCGDSATGILTLVKGVIAQPVSVESKIQRGDFVVRQMVAPWPEKPSILYVFTLLYAYNGGMATFKNQVRVSLPISDELPEKMELIRVQSSAGDDSVQNPEVWIDIDFLFEKGVLTFNTQTPGIYLLIDAD